MSVTPFIVSGLLNVLVFGWRLVFLGDALIAFVAISPPSRFVLESPRWLVTHGCAGEAERLVVQMEATANRRLGRGLPAVREVSPEEAFRAFSTRSLRRRPLAGRLAVTLAFWLVWCITVYGYLGHEPTPLIRIDPSEPSGVLYSALGDIAIPVGAIIALVIVELWQHEYIVATVAFVFIATLILVMLS